MKGFTNPNNDSELIRKAKLDINQFGHLYDKYYVSIFRFVLIRIQDEQSCADLVSQVFMKAMVNLKKYEDRGHPFSSWLYRIALNECNQFFRHQKKWVEVELKSEHLNHLIDEIEELDKKNDRVVILEILNSLDEADSAILEMRFFEGRKFKEMGEILGISEENAKMRVYRLIKRIKSGITQKMK